MGKKKIVQQNTEKALKESETVALSTAKKSIEPLRHRVSDGRVYINASYNNTLVTVTDLNGNVISWMSAGSLGFSGPKKATPFAASKVADAITEKIKKSGPINVEILIRGVGRGRDAAVKALAAKGLNILSIKDVTPIPHNGPRPPKVRRV